MTNQTDNNIPDVNPTTGLPLIEGTYVDVGGNPYGELPRCWQPTYGSVPSIPTEPPGFEPW